MNKSTFRAARLLLNEDVNPTRESWLLAFGVARRALIVLEKLLPGECPECEGKGTIPDATVGFAFDATCEACNGSEKVWDEDLTAAVIRDLAVDRQTATEALRAIVDTLTDTKEGE
jgi:hypothetical protein